MAGVGLTVRGETETEHQGKREGTRIGTGKGKGRRASETRERDERRKGLMVQ